MICLMAGAIVVPLMSDALTLAWTHSVEKTAWEEDWRLTQEGLALTAARVRGSGAGMDPGSGAVFRDGAWSWRPSLPPQRELVLRRSGATADWRICVAGRCRSMEADLPADADPVRLAACPAGPQGPRSGPAATD